MLFCSVRVSCAGEARLRIGVGAYLLVGAVVWTVFVDGLVEVTRWVKEDLVLEGTIEARSVGVILCL